MPGTEKEMDAVIAKARAKADRAFEAVEDAMKEMQGKTPNIGYSVAYDAARLHYDRCTRELEEAINAKADMYPPKAADINVDSTEDNE